MYIRNRLQMLSSSGFTAFELIGVLAVLIFVIIITNKIMNDIHKTKEYNQLADQVKNFSQRAAKYIEDDYRNQAINSGNQDQVISYTEIASHIPENLSAFTKRGQYPCIYITNDLTHKQISSLRAYLILGNVNSSDRKFTGGKLNKLDIQKIVHIIGNNGGIIIQKNGDYIIEGGIEAEVKLSLTAIETMKQKCEFASPFPLNSLVIDLSKNSTLFSALKGNLDSQSTNTDSDPSLKKSGDDSLATMQTNLYLDNIYQESYDYPQYDCPTMSQIKDDVNSFCANSNPGMQMRPGSAAWIGVARTGEQSCTIRASARFYTTDYWRNCDGVNMGYAGGLCPATSDGSNTIVPDSALWSPVQLIGDQCVSRASATYQTLDCDFMSSCKLIPGTDQQYDCPGTLNQFCPTSSGYWPAGIANQAAYNPILSGDRCFVHFYCRNFKYQYNPNGGARGELPANKHIYSDVSCGERRIAANIGARENDQGFKECGTKTIPTLTSRVNVPPKHVYKALDFGQSRVTNDNRRIQLKSNAPTGDAITNSQLNVNNAGLEAGFIAPTSHGINSGDKCEANSIGKIAQDLSAGSGLPTSQLQCTYNPTFCADDGYCYLPVKSSSFTYAYNPRRQKGQCPPGTVVDSSQPGDGIFHIACPSPQPGWISSQWPIGVEINGYTNNITKMTFYQGYQTVCRYFQQGNTQINNDVIVSALVKLRCTNDSLTYIVDNYRP